MAYGTYGYGQYNTHPNMPERASPMERERDAKLKAALHELVKSFLEEPAELLAPQEGPAIGHLGGE